MRLAVISFTRAGGLLCGSLVRRTRELGWDCRGYVTDRFIHSMPEEAGLCPVQEPVAEWTKTKFGWADGLVYIGAAGIAVRAIAPCLKDKMTDPAVVVVDENANYAIALLSGHLGGANELTLRIAKLLGAEPVITTASDVRQKEAIDVWAKKRGLRLSDRTLAKQVAACILDGEPVGFYSDYPLGDTIPEGFCSGMPCRLNVWITSRRVPSANADLQFLRLIPQTLTVGVGCKKGVEQSRVMQRLAETLTEENLELMAVAGLASIDLKKEEVGIRAVAEELGVPFHTFPAKTLNAMPGIYTPSAFVKGVTGTDNVCERAALAGAGEKGRLLVKKRAADGITIAVAGIYPEIG